LLGDLKVLEIVQEDLSFGTRILGDLGALIISVKDISKPIEKDDPKFLYHNINKYVFGLNVRSPQAGKILLDLVKKTDVVLTDEGISSFIEDDYLDKFLKANPGISHLRIRGSFCGNGVGYPYEDVLISARSGQMSLTGSPSGSPTPLGGKQTLYTGSLYIAIAILLMFYKRTLEGSGLAADLSLEECAISAIEDVIIRFISDGIPPRRNGAFSQNKHFAILPCEDGHVQMTILYQLETLLELLGFAITQKELTEDEILLRKKTNKIIARLRMWMKNYSCHEIFHLGQTMHFPWAPLFSIKDVLRSPQLQNRKFFRRVKRGDSLTIPFVPYKVRGFKPGIKLPDMERDTREICLNYLKMSAYRFSRLKKDGVL